MNLRAYLTRCRWCGCRRKRQVFTNGVCPTCKAEALGWLSEMGCVTTWPILVQR